MKNLHEEVIALLGNTTVMSEIHSMTTEIVNLCINFALCKHDNERITLVDQIFMKPYLCFCQKCTCVFAKSVCLLFCFINPSGISSLL